jgi:hypothetical protein
LFGDRTLFCTAPVIHELEPHAKEGCVGIAQSCIVSTNRNCCATTKIEDRKKKRRGYPHRQHTSTHTHTHTGLSLHLHPLPTNQPTNALPPPLPPRPVLLVTMRHVLSNLRLAIPIDTARPTLTPRAHPRIMLQARRAAPPGPLVAAPNIRPERRTRRKRRCSSSTYRARRTTTSTTSTATTTAAAAAAHGRRARVRGHGPHGPPLLGDGRRRPLDVVVRVWVAAGEFALEAPQGCFREAGDGGRVARAHAPVDLGVGSALVRRRAGVYDQLVRVC